MPFCRAMEKIAEICRNAGIRLVGRGDQLGQEVLAVLEQPSDLADARGEPPVDRLERFDAGREGLAGRNPLVVNGLVVVVERDLTDRHRGEEEPGVVAPGQTYRRDPVAEVVHRVDGQPQPLVGADVDQPALAGVDGLAVGARPLDDLGHAGEA